MFDQFVIFVKVRGEGRGCCLSVRRMRDVTVEIGVISIEMKRIFQSVRSLMKIRNNLGASNTALGYSSLDKTRRRKDSIESHTLGMRVEDISNPRVELGLDAIGREFGEQGGMPDCIKSLRLSGLERQL